MKALEMQVVGLLSSIGYPLESASPASDLSLSSLEVLLLHESIEDEFGLRVPASAVTEESFASIAAICDLVVQLSHARAGS